MGEYKVWVSEKQTVSGTLIAEARCDHPVFCFDVELHFILLNDAACRHLGKQADELIDRSMLDVFPQMTSSRNHRNLLRALGGSVISEDLVESSFGPLFRCAYKPVIEHEKISGVFLTAFRLSN